MVQLAKYELTDEIINAILKYSTQYKLEPKLIQAVIETESMPVYNPWSFRYEENYPYLYSDKELAGLLKMSRAAMRCAQKSSFGLMQIMGAVAYEYGFRGYPGELYNIDLNVRYGCQHLRNIIDRKKVSKPEEIYDCFNSGRADSSDGNQGNVTRFIKIYENLKSNS